MCSQIVIVCTELLEKSLLVRIHTLGVDIIKGPIETYNYRSRLPCVTEWGTWRMWLTLAADPHVCSTFYNCAGSGRTAIKKGPSCNFKDLLLS